MNTTQKWQKQDGIIYTSVTSDGTSGYDWVPRLEGQGKGLIPEEVKRILYGPDFSHTNGVATNLAIFTDAVFSDEQRKTDYICEEAARRGFRTPRVEVACLCREKFTDDDMMAMGIRWWLITMHRPVELRHGIPSLIGSIRGGQTNRDNTSMHAYHGDSDHKWRCDWPDGQGYVFEC